MTRFPPAAARRRRDAAVPAFALYGEPRPRTGGLALHAERIAVRGEVNAWHIRAHRHRQLCQLLLVVAGRVRASLDGREQAFAGPCAIFVPPDAVHAFRFRPGTEGLVVTFAPAVLPADARALPAAPVGQALPSTAPLLDLGAMLLTEFEVPGRQAGREAVLRALLAVMTIWFRRGLPSTAAQPAAAVTADAQLLQRYCALIEQQLRKPLPVAHNAAQLGVSEARLRRCCRQLAGQSPLQLLQARQLQEAQRQLHYTTRPIRRIAFDLGFVDPAYFSRFFMRRTGLSPRVYRRQGESGGAGW